MCIGETAPISMAAALESLVRSVLRQAKEARDNNDPRQPVTILARDLKRAFESEELNQLPKQTIVPALLRARKRAPRRHPIKSRRSN